MKSLLKYSTFCIIITHATFFFAKQNITGTYKNVNNNELVFKDSSFYFIDLTPNLPYVCCDTITLGTFKYSHGRNLIYLSTADFLNTEITYLDVKEFNKKPSNDSMIFHFRNPIEDFFNKNGSGVRYLVYDLLLSNDSLYHYSHYTISNNNRLIIPTPHVGITTLKLLIYPDYNLKVRNLGIRKIYTIDYSIKDSKSNYFEINMPEITMQYLSYLRLNRDIVKVINKNKLEWDGEIFTKEK